MRCENLTEMLIGKNMPLFCNDSGITQDFLSHMVALEKPARNIEFTAVINGQFMSFQISADSIDYYGEESVMVCVKDITGSKVIAETFTRENYRQRELSGYSLEPFFEASPDGDLTYLNQAAKSLFNHTAGYTITGQANILSLIIPDERERFHSHMLSLLNGKQKGAVPYTVVKADGSMFPIIIMAVPATDAAENTYIRGLIREMSQIKNTTEPHEFYKHLYHTVFENSGTAIAITENNLSFADVNAYFKRLSGHTRSEFASSFNMGDFIDQKTLDKIKHVLAGYT